MIPPLEARRTAYDDVEQRVAALLDGIDDTIAMMATVTCELHHAFSHFHWTGFYRVTRPGHLVIGPYQGTHGCLEIEFERGVCGAAARTNSTQLVPDVHAFPGHIACSTSTRSEIVVPLTDPDNRVVAVLDIDSNDPAAFDAYDQERLETLAATLSRFFPSSPTGNAVR